MSETINELPLRLLAPARANEKNDNVGVFYAIRSSCSPSLLFPWDGEPHVIYLTGDQAFKFYNPKMSGSVHGLLVRDCEFVVDVGSMYNPNGKPEMPGALVIQHGDIYIVGQNANGMMSDWSPIPTGMKLTEGSDTAGQEFRFASWKLVRRDGDNTYELFSFTGAVAKPA